MAVIVTTMFPSALLTAIKKAIDDKHIDTWKYDKDGDFTHTRPQWQDKAWLRPHVQQGVLTLGLLGEKTVVMAKAIYGVYHGRFIEMLLTHFDEKFTTAEATAMGTSVDSFKLQT